MKHFTPVSILMVAVLFAFSACATTPSAKGNPDVPLPPYLYIVPPDSSVPAERARFSGKWRGVWDLSALDHILVVEFIYGDRVMVIYATGRAVSPGYQIEPKWFQWQGRFNSYDELVLDTFDNEAIVTYRMNRNGTLNGTYYQSRHTGLAEKGQATMKRFQ